MVVQWSLDWPTENGWVNYDSLQVLAYFTTIFIAAPLAILTGVRMSGVWPKNATRLNRLYPVEGARAIHFPVMLYFVAFIIVHVALVFATGALRNLNHMYAIQSSVDPDAYAVNWTGFWIFFASMIVIIGGWIAARPLVLSGIARAFGKVTGRSPMDARRDAIATGIWRVLAPNAGPMTLEGTNSYVLHASGADAAAIIDPGPMVGEHLEALRSAGLVGPLLLTHEHRDHTESAEQLAAEFGAVVRGLAPEQCIGGPSLSDGERVDAGGFVLEVVATPGHSDASVSFRLAPDPRLPELPHGAVFTGDTILGRGSTVLVGTGDAVGDYLRSLSRLAGFSGAAVLPVHGATGEDVAVAARRLDRHRRKRVDEIATLLTEHAWDANDPSTLDSLLPRLYSTLDEAALRPARISIQAHLRHLGGD